MSAVKQAFRSPGAWEQWLRKREARGRIRVEPSASGSKVSSSAGDLRKAASSFGVDRKPSITANTS